MTEEARKSAKSPRLIDIANRLNLTKVSVSKGLRDHPDMAPATSALIKRTAMEMGYLPNRLARSLRSSRSNLVGLVVPKIRHAFFAELVAGVEEAASEQRIELLLGVSNEDPVVERRHIETFLSMRADALLVSTTEHNPPEQQQFYQDARTRGTPLIFFDRLPTTLEPGWPTVTMNDAGGARTAIDAAVARGYRRIALIGGPLATNIGTERLRGYCEGMAQHQLEIADGWIVERRFDERSGYDGFLSLWSGSNKPDAILCASYPIALGVIDAMRLHAPETLGRILILFFGLHEQLRLMPQPCVCLVQPALALGREAMRLAIAVRDEMPNARSKPLAIEIATDCNARPSYQI
ncbi:LacI family DNA-binding transcriptional regulator [Sphingomonas sp. FW199]|uniref:LacI family DNA-binding transcriptional regulator n=1 Tax=Sphingomonas sp. FW199 TaxID=3400217 RepID=UPI003CF82384